MSAASSGRPRADAPLFTLGYEGARIDAFIDTLRTAGVAVLLDVRAAAFSRKPDFCKRALGQHLSAAGIDYCHMPGLGNPKAGREAARAGDRAGFHRIFDAHMASPAAQAALAQAAECAAAAPVCLMCLEADAAQCHRSIVATHLCTLTGQVVDHLRVDGQRSLAL